MADIPKNIKKLRIQKNMTQDALAEKLFVTRQTVSNYETGKSRPDVDTLVRIAEALDTDINTLIYHPIPAVKNPNLIRLAVGAGLTGILGLSQFLLSSFGKVYYYNSYFIGLYLGCLCILRPLLLLVLGWTLTQVTAMALKRQPLQGNWVTYVRYSLFVLFLLWFLLALWYFGAQMLNEYLYTNHIRGQWVPSVGINVAPESWHMLPPPVPEWLKQFGNNFLFPFCIKYPPVFLIWGCTFWLFDFPKAKQ